MENRRQFLQKLGFISLATGTGQFLPFDSFGRSSEFKAVANNGKMTSLSPSDLFSVLNLELPELNSVKVALTQKGYDAALNELLKYYRKQYSEYSESIKRKETRFKSTSLNRANDLGNHIFQYGPYDAANYGSEIDWSYDPAGDIEWVASIHRFNWANDLLNAYRETGDVRYANTFVNLTTDWIKKHPLEKTIDIVHPVYGWKGYPWLDLQTGIRATNICRCFREFVHTKAFTPQFLAILLGSLYDHQVKTEILPRVMKVHNKSIFEQRGFVNVIHTIPEFKDKDRWLDLAIETTCICLFPQITTDGVQREWCGGYHYGVYRDVLEIDSRVKDLGREMPTNYQNRVKAMADHIFGISTPDLGFPMFGDTARDKRTSEDRSTWQLYNMLIEATEKFNDPKYKALADLDIHQLPTNGSAAFLDAGLYAMRNKWSTDQVYMALHCSPPAISIHDTPDNGTFELYAYGRWLMPDSGFYTYGHDKKAREWHRQTKVHSTMTLNGKDTDFIGRNLLWESSDDLDVLCVENQSYKHFLHRRTVWFANKMGETPFFVILDEAIGDANGDIAIHFPMAPGAIKTDNDTGRILTDFDDANLLVQVQGKKPIILEEEEGWHAWKYGNREKRTSVSAVHQGSGPFTFASILIPYKGTTIPECKLLTDLETIITGVEPITLSVEIDGKIWTLNRKV